MTKSLLKTAYAFIAVFLFGCGVDSSDPQLVLKKYRELTRENNNEEIYDDFISAKSKETIDKDNFVKLRQLEWKGDLLTIDIKEIKIDSSALKRFKVVETVKDVGTPTKTEYYYTLIKEQNGWKIIWSGQLLTLGDEKLRQGDFEEGMTIYRKSLELNPFDSRPYRKMAHCYLEDNKLPEKDRVKLAIQNLSFALRLEEDNGDNYMDFFRLYTSLHDDKSALTYLQQGLEHVIDAKEKANFYANISGVYLNTNDLPSAETNIKRSLDLDPNETFNWYLNGKILHTQNKIELAKASYKMASSLSQMDSSKQGDLYANYFICLLVTNKCDSATEYFNKAMDITPNDKRNEAVHSTLSKLRSKLFECFLLKQTTFEKTQEEFNRKYNSTSNQAKASFIFNEVNKWTSDYMKSDNFRFFNWQGRLTSIYTDKGGNEASVTIESRAVTYHAKVSYNSSTYKMLMEVDEGRVVVFSGRFETKGELLKEKSSTESGRMYNPEFDIQLNSIEKK